jgi:hypothetical protein
VPLTGFASALPEVPAEVWLQPMTVVAATKIVISRTPIRPSAAEQCKAAAIDEIEKILNVQLASAAAADQNVKMTWLRHDN